MLDPNIAFQNAIKGKQVKVAEIYDVTLNNGAVYHYTSHSQDIIWNAANDIYEAVPIRRDSIQSSIDLEVNVVDIQLQNISGDLFNKLQNNTLNGVKVVIKRILWDQPYAADMELTYFIGTADVSFDRKILTLSCKSILDSLNIRVPRDIYQEPCNKRLFDGGCTLVQDDFKYTGVISTGSRLKYTDAIRGPVYKISFDNGNSSTPIEVGDIITAP
jgi:hypothetical protein